jgi:PAS domain S-box-containing protein
LTSNGELIQAQDTVKGSEARFRELMEWLPAVVYEADVEPSREWHYVSPQIEAMLGYSPEEWLADPDLWEERLHPDDRAEVVDLERREAEIGKGGAVTMVSE